MRRSSFWFISWTSIPALIARANSFFPVVGLLRVQSLVVRLRRWGSNGRLGTFFCLSTERPPECDTHVVEVDRREPLEVEHPRATADLLRQILLMRRQ